MPYEHTRNQHELKKLIYKKGYTISQFAKESGVSNWTLNAIFRHKFKQTRGDTIYCLAKTMNMPYEEMEVMCNASL